MSEATGGQRRTAPDDNTTQTRRVKRTRPRLQQDVERLEAERKYNWYNSTVDVLVKGHEDQRIFTLYVGKAKDASPVFAHRIILDPDTGKHVYKTGHIAGEPEAFKLLLQWLHEGEIYYEPAMFRRILTGNKAFQNADGTFCIYMPLLRLMSLAHRVRIPALVNKSIDTFVALSKLESPPSMGTVKHIFQMTGADSRIRRLVVHIWSRSDTPLPLTNCPADFMHAVANECKELTKPGIKGDKPRTRNYRPKDYHYPPVDKSEWPAQIVDLTLSDDGDEQSPATPTDNSHDHRMRGPKREASATLQFQAPVANMQFDD